MTITFDIALFRASFPAFGSATVYSDVALQGYWDAAILFMSDSSSPCLILNGDARKRALNLMVAHLLATADIIKTGQTPGLLESAAIDKVRVSMTPPPLRNAWQWWLFTTPYGMQLWALLSAKAAGGLFVGGDVTRSGFRRAAGGFSG